MTARYVISFRRTGLGDRLICLGAAWRFARATGRILVADWRFSRYSPDLTANLFPLCFQPLPELAGVPLVGDERVGQLQLPRPRYPSLWDDEGLLAYPFRRPFDTLLSDRDAAVELIRAGRDVVAPTVVFDACINDGLVLWQESRSFLGALRPTPSVAAEVASFRRERLGPGPLIGLHVRHGNGGDIMGHAPYWHSVEAAIERCVRAVRLARKQLQVTATVFLCTDSSEIEHALRKRLRRVVCRPKSFRPKGAGELHWWRGAYQGRDDALIEMLLLAECDALIRYPRGSFFSFYAAVMKPSRGVPPTTVYELQHPCDPADPLSPALLL